jgi:hypothetical protein
MNRKELGKELDVSACNVDDWLLLGCLSRKIRSKWEFEIEPVKFYLRTNKIAVKRVNLQAFPKKPVFDQRWFGGRCPICAVRWFLGEIAGRL